VHIENLKKGKYVAVTADRRETPFGHHADMTLTGVPYKVIAISAPFVALQDVRGVVHSIDTRDFTLSLVTTEYWNVYYSKAPVRKRRQRHKPINDGWVRCVNCGTRMAQRYTGVWQYICPECGTLGELVEAK
jgi:hypothetical protein